MQKNSNLFTRSPCQGGKAGILTRMVHLALVCAPGQKNCSNDQRNLQTWNFQFLLFLICSPCNLVQVLQAHSHPQGREQNWQEEQHQGNLCSSVALNKGRLFNWDETKPVKSASNSLSGSHPRPTKAILCLGNLRAQ